MMTNHGLVKGETSQSLFVVPTFPVQVGACWQEIGLVLLALLFIQTQIRLGAGFVIKVLFMKKGYVAFCYFNQEWYYPVDKASNLCVSL